LKRTRDLLGCARDQRGTLGQLREHVTRLKDELKRQHSAGASTRPANVADRRRHSPPIEGYTAARSLRVRSR
jgi:hypothetical protein